VWLTWAVELHAGHVTSSGIGLHGIECTAIWASAIATPS